MVRHLKSPIVFKSSKILLGSNTIGATKIPAAFHGESYFVRWTVSSGKRPVDGEQWTSVCEPACRRA